MVGSALFYTQFVHAYWCFHGMSFHYCRGYPRPYIEEADSPSGPFDRVYRADLAVDAAVWLALLASPVILCERLARARFRLSLKALLGILTGAAVLFSIVDWRGVLTQAREPSLLFCSLSIVFAVGCAILMLLWGLNGILGLAYTRARRRLALSNTDQRPTASSSEEIR